MTGWTAPPAAAKDPAVPLAERLAALAGWWDAESSRLLTTRPGDSAEVAAMRKQRGYQYSLCASDLRAVMEVK